MEYNYKFTKSIEIMSHIFEVTVTSVFLYGFVLIWLKLSAFLVLDSRKRQKLFFAAINHNGWLYNATAYYLNTTVVHTLWLSPHLHFSVLPVASKYKSSPFCSLDCKYFFNVQGKIITMLVCRNAWLYSCQLIIEFCTRYSKSFV
jgi:hypothetical protein